MWAAPEIGDARPGVLDFDDSAFQTNPWPLYEWHRRHAPVVWEPQEQCFFVFGYDVVRTAMAASQFGVFHPFRVSRRAFGPSMLDSDGEHHAAQRAAVAPSLRGHELQTYGDEIIRPTARAVIDDFIDDESADFVATLATTLPMRVMCRLLGLPEADAAWLHGVMRPLVRYVDHAPVNLGDVVERRQELRDYLAGAIGHADGPLLRGLCSSAVLDETEVFNNSILLLAAGTETTAAAIGNLLRRVVIEPGLYARLRGDRAMVSSVVVETLRHEPPLHVTLRFLTADTELGGVEMPRGSAVQVCLASANRDPSAFPDPNKWDPGRTGKVPMTFGMGRHACLGMGLALVELQTVLDVVLDRFESMQFADGEVPVVHGRTFRTTDSLRMSFRADATQEGR